MSEVRADKPRRSKATHATRVRRTEEVLRIVLDGAQHWDVVEFIREQEGVPGSAWYVVEGRTPLSHGSIRKYLELAYSLIDEAHAKSRRKLFRTHLAKRRNLYAKAVAQGDIRAALAVLADEAKMLGLYPSADAATLAELRQLEADLAAITAKQKVVQQ